MRGWLVLLAMIASPAAAQADRPFCADRPGLDTPPCTLPAGKAMVEIGLADWTLDRTATSRTDTLIAGDTLVRLGIADHAEVQLGWTAFGHVRERDRLSGAIDTSSSTGDVTIAVRRNLVHPDGAQTAIAVMPFVTLPTGGGTIGAGDWGAGVIVPVTFDLGSGLSLGLSPEIDAAVDADRDGRHLAYGNAFSLGIELNDALSATAEVQVQRDRDPGGHSTQALAALSFGWQPDNDSQIDIGSNVGLNRGSPDIQLYAGIARRF